MEEQHPDSDIILWDFNRENLSFELPKYREDNICPTRDRNFYSFKHSLPLHHHNKERILLSSHLVSHVQRYVNTDIMG